jgi:ribosomal protein L11 methyltransferase
MTAFVLLLTCTRAEAEALPESGEIFPDLLDPPTLMVDEPDPHRPDDWLLFAYFNELPDTVLIERVQALAPSASTYSLTPLAEADWVTMSQRDLLPVRAGRFLAHDAAHADAVRPGDIAIRLEAGLAFGTGQHMTTHGCLKALDRLARGHKFRNIVDLGTGTGILAIAAARRWPRARVIASDIDPVAVAVARGNMRGNRVRPGQTPGRLALVIAAGMGHRALRARGPYDLMIANILAGPLIAMAPAIAARLAPGGFLVLAGLLDTQANAVVRAYHQHGLVPASQGPRQHPSTEWPTLVLTRPRKTCRAR